MWETGSKPTYSKYKLSGTTIGSCRIGEVVFSGIVAINDSGTSKVCPTKLVTGTTSVPLNDVTYTNTKTPTITSISPRYGKVSGDEVITITGSNFLNGSTSVKFDGITCATTSVTTTEIKCTTGKRPGDDPNPSVLVSVAGYGNAATQGNTFTYVQYWSEPSTWGYDAPPQFGEAI